MQRAARSAEVLLLDGKAKKEGGGGRIWFEPAACQLMHPEGKVFLQESQALGGPHPVALYGADAFLPLQEAGARTHTGNTSV